MRIAIAQLRKLRLPYHYEEELDLSEELNGFEDIISSSPVKVVGVISEVSHERYLISMEINTSLVIESAISLKPINVAISTSTEEVYAKSLISEDEDVNLIEGQTIDTTESIVTAILCEKPMRTVGEDEEFLSDDVEEEESINPAFASLSELLK
ncbi:MAG: YceD family protein [Anaeroplasmataceae bacterium]